MAGFNPGDTIDYEGEATALTHQTIKGKWVVVGLVSLDVEFGYMVEPYGAEELGARFIIPLDHALRDAQLSEQAGG